MNAELMSLNEELAKKMKALKKAFAGKTIEQQKSENALRIEFQNDLLAQSTKFYEEKTELKLSYELRL